MTSVNIYVDYDNDGPGSPVYLKTESTVPGSPDTWTFDDPAPEVNGVGDHVTETAVIIIKDVDTDRDDYTSYESRSSISSVSLRP